MITASIDASGAIAKLKNIRMAVSSRVTDAVERGTKAVLERVQEKLSGEVLKARSGRLKNSIVETGLSTNSGVIADFVATDGSVPYARIQEFGGRIDIPEIVPRSTKALAFEYGGKLVFAKRAAAHTVTIPDRSYLRSALAELSLALTDGIRKIVTEALE